MISPAFIKPGDKICIVAPAGKIKEERVLPAVTWLRQQGYFVELGEHTFSSHFQFSSTDEQRLADLQTALDDPETKAIICARGGYGTVRIIDKLDFSGFESYPKWLVGYSDITALHLAINNLGIESIHGTMPPFFFDKQGAVTENLSSLMTLLTDEKQQYIFSSEKLQRNGTSAGELIGGNLSLICSLLGTKYEINTEGKLLFIEDIDEYRYHIDRMMYQLKLAGKLEHIAGLIVGDFTDVKDNDDPFGQSVEEIIWEAVKSYKFPVSFGLNAGHGDLNLALAFGRKWELKVSSNSTIISTE